MLLINDADLRGKNYQPCPIHPHSATRSRDDVVSSRGRPACFASLSQSLFVIIFTSFFLLLNSAVRVKAGTVELPSADDFLVQGLEEEEPAYGSFQGKMYAGLLPSYNVSSKSATEGGQLAFWYFVQDNRTYPDGFTVWLNGGPGCSSFGGAMFENSPVTLGAWPAGYYGIDIHTPLVANPYAWSRHSAILYVEQPHGTGYSTGPIPQNETEVARYFYYFLQNFRRVFGLDVDVSSSPVSFFGESYAGMYVPSIAHYIHTQNQKLPDDDPRQIRLYGIGLGNGWVSAKVQGPTVIDFAWWHGMIDLSTKNALYNEWYNCRDGSPVSEDDSTFHSFTVPDECNIMGAVLEAAGAGAVRWGGPNTYDVTTWDSYYFLDAPEGTMAEFYNNPKVRKILHFDGPGTPEHWLECAPGAGRRRQLSDSVETEPLGKILLAHDEPMSVLPYIADLLDDANLTRVLIYSGDLDMSTNAQGSELLLDQMKWSGAEGWHNSSVFERGLWFVSNQRHTRSSSANDDFDGQQRPPHIMLGGYAKSYQNLDFVVVVNSGHLVPMNVPIVALDLFDRFWGDRSFLDKALPKFDIIRKKHLGKELSREDRTTAMTNGGGSGDSSLWAILLRAVLFIWVGFLFGFAASSSSSSSSRSSSGFRRPEFPPPSHVGASARRGPSSYRYDSIPSSAPTLEV